MIVALSIQQISAIVSLFKDRGVKAATYLSLWALPPPIV